MAISYAGGTLKFLIALQLGIFVYRVPTGLKTIKIKLKMSSACDCKYLEKSYRTLQMDFRSLEDKYETLEWKNRRLSNQLIKELKTRRKIAGKTYSGQKMFAMELKIEGHRQALADKFKKIHDLNNKLVKLVLKDQDIEAINSKLVKIWKKNKKLRLENEELGLENDKLRSQNGNLTIENIGNRAKFYLLEDEKRKIALENDHLRTVNENLELTVEDFENQEKQFKKKMMQLIEHAPNVDRCAKKGSKRKALDEANLNKRTKQ